jgi:hypothetical protein
MQKTEVLLTMTDLSSQYLALSERSPQSESFKQAVHEPLLQKSQLCTTRASSLKEQMPSLHE